MISFFISIVVLIVGYLFYGKFIAKIFAPDDRETPACSINDGVDFVPMPKWKVFLIQLLNIAGTGPIFGALSGAIFGPIVYLWIVFGCIFAGSVHDYMCGMLSERNRGASIAEITGFYLGSTMKNIMRCFSIVLLIMCGVVFTTGPAQLIAMLLNGDADLWLSIVLIYYLIATFVPIDKVIGRVYPLFGLCLLVMAFGVSGSLLVKDTFKMPELWDNFYNMHAFGTPVWPFMFITVACGAISGFHATQTPMMARCITSEKQGRFVFYGAMIAEGIIALVWAAAGVTCYENSQALLEAGGGCSAVVYDICTSAMGKVGAVLAMVGVIICPLSSGDTAFRAARLTVADWIGVDQQDWKKRLAITIPVLLSGALICNLDYSVVWRYFSWSNQTLATIALWSASVYLVQKGKNHKITSCPATFMSAVSFTYFACADECIGSAWRYFNISPDFYYPFSAGAGIIFAICLYMFFRKMNEVI